MSEKMRAAPAMPLFGDAYIADTRHLSLEEHGAYLQLLMIAWRSGDCSLPDDDKRISQMLGVTVAKWRKLKPTVMAFWSLDNGRWSQKRLAKERKFVNEKREKNKQSAEARWAGQVIENKQGDECERISERTSERSAPPPPPTSVDKSTGGEPPDPVKQMFDMGVAMLKSQGHDEREARSIVGKWRKGRSPGEVVAGLIDAKTRSISNLVEWMPKRLSGAGPPSFLDHYERERKLRASG